MILARHCDKTNALNYAWDKKSEKTNPKPQKQQIWCFTWSNKNATDMLYPMGPPKPICYSNWIAFIENESTTVLIINIPLLLPYYSLKDSSYRSAGPVTWAGRPAQSASAALRLAAGPHAGVQSRAAGSGTKIMEIWMFNYLWRMSNTNKLKSITKWNWVVPLDRYHQCHHFGWGIFPCWLEKN